MGKLILKLFDIGVFKFGRFKLKSGLTSPFYIDMRILVSHPKVLNKVARAYLRVLKNLKFDRIAAVPYAAIPIATAVSLETGFPMIYLRKETKKYGLRKPIEGEFKKREKIVIIDDMVTTGESKLEVIVPLKKAGLVVRDVVVLIDREQGAAEQLRRHGYRLHSYVGFRKILDFLRRENRISNKTYSLCAAYLNDESN